jgi:S1-C subfamily serine protease
MGNAMGDYIDTMATGRISGLRRDIFVTDAEGSPERLNDLIQTSVKLYPGDSGGPLMNSDGEVVGVDVASQVGADVSFSIPVNTAKDAIQEAGISL